MLVAIDNLNVLEKELKLQRKKGVQFGRKAILSTKENNIIYKQHEKGKSVVLLSKLFHVAHNTIYRTIKDVVYLTTLRCSKIQVFLGKDFH